MNNCMNISIWSITYQHYDKIINQSLNTCIIVAGVGRIYSIQGEVWTLAEAMIRIRLVWPGNTFLVMTVFLLE